MPFPEYKRPEFPEWWSERRVFDGGRNERVPIGYDYSVIKHYIPSWPSKGGGKTEWKEFKQGLEALSERAKKWKQMEEEAWKGHVKDNEEAMRLRDDALIILWRDYFGHSSPSMKQPYSGTDAVCEIMNDMGKRLLVENLYRIPYMNEDEAADMATDIILDNHHDP